MDETAIEEQIEYILQHVASCEAYLENHHLKIEPSNILLVFLLTWENTPPHPPSLYKIFVERWPNYSYARFSQELTWLSSFGLVTEQLLKDPPPFDKNPGKTRNLADIVCVNCQKSVQIDSSLINNQDLINQFETNFANWTELSMAWEVRGLCPQCSLHCNRSVGIF